MPRSLSRFGSLAQRSLLALLLHAAPLAGWGYVSWLASEQLRPGSQPAAATVTPGAGGADLEVVDRATAATAPADTPPQRPSRGQPGERQARPG